MWPRFILVGGAGSPVFSVCAGRALLDPRFLFIDEGYNLRPTELNAAIGIHQLASLDKRNTKRKIVNRKMMDIAREFSVDTIKVYEETDVALFAFPVMLENETERDALSLHLESNGIQTRPIVAGNLARHPGMAKHLASGLKLNGANKVSDCGLYWGLHPYVTDEQLMHLEKTLASHFKGVGAAWSNSNISIAARGWRYE